MTEPRDTISHAVTRVARLHRAAAGQLLRRSGLYPGQELLMMQLWDHGPQPQSRLIEELGLDASTVTRMVQRLEQAGFVRRRRSDTDRRAVVVEPTAAAQALHEQVLHAWEQLEDLTLHGLAEPERATIATLLGRIEDNLREPADPPGRPGGRAGGADGG
ncbi:MarR family winged helix-turn-helix transcriptional regulator [Streptomyces sp. NPDC018031]|uniref:MarR family winged helix-turn-helix transcriptional regulator n=1 Tax=Streptomyces sp. NPDC018031 TaxID=3365033 RepID=UPI0037AA4C04